MRVVALIAAGGRGVRAGGKVPKQFRLLAGRPVLARTLSVFEGLDAIGGIVIAVPRGYVARCREEIVARYRFAKVEAVVTGGQTRRDSVHRALSAIDPECDMICIHDGARPLVAPQVVEKVIRAAAEDGAAIAARPVTDTIKRAEQDGRIGATLDRSLFWAAQTPQAFRAELIREAYRAAIRDDYDATDDAVLVERMGLPVRLVEGNPENLKLTTEADFAVAAAILREKGKRR